MSSALRSPLSIACVIFLAYAVQTPVYAAGGVHVVIIEPQAPDSWLVREFIDNSLIERISTPIDSGTRLLKPGIQFPGTSPARIETFLVAREKPLIVFASEDLDKLEGRITGAEQSVEGIELENELRRQILKALFQVPFWPYLAASEIPSRGIDLERTTRLPYLREENFPAASFAGDGRFPSWEVIESTNQGVRLRNAGGSGAGSGLVLEYIVQGSLRDAYIDEPASATICALYILDNSPWQISGAPAISIPAKELIALIGDVTVPPEEGVRTSAVHIVDSEGMLGRYLVVPSPDSRYSSLSWIQTAAPLESRQGAGEVKTAAGREWSSGGFGLALVACWVAFGIAVVIGNLIYRFASLSWLALVGSGMAVYPLYLLLSLLTSGLWGMGFMPGAAVAARFIAPEGRRVAAFGSILAASFLVALLSSLISR